MKIFTHAFVGSGEKLPKRFIRLSESDGFFLFMFISRPRHHVMPAKQMPSQPLNRIPYFMLQSIDRRSLFLIKKKLGFGRVMRAPASASDPNKRKGEPLYRFIVVSRFGVLKLIHLFARKFVSKRGCLRLAK